jgi:histidinol-phosphate aminotransferase
VSVLGVAAAIAALNDVAHIDNERARNAQVRAFTIKALADLGCKSSDSQANFIFVEVHRTAKDFREACVKSGVMVGRDFPPLETTHARISLGTMDEMTKATEVFRSVLRAPAATMAGKAQ